MKKKEIKKTKIKPRKKTEMAENQFSVILEDINSKFDLMSEGFLGVDKRFDDLDKKVDDNQRETNSNFKTVFEYLSKIDDEIQSIKLELVNLRSELKNKADLDKLFQLEKRVIVIEKQLNIARF